VQTHLVLSVGSDPKLLQSRNLVLLTAGYAVRVATNAGDAINIFRSADFEVVVICHSIPEEERLRLIADMREENASAKIVVIRKNGQLSARLADEAVHSMDGAEQLLAAIASALRR
jgi:DNA-binding response OmpR family regulator